MQQVSILDVSLKLLSIKRSALRAHMYEVVRCLAFKHELASQGRSVNYLTRQLAHRHCSLGATRNVCGLCKQERVIGRHDKR